MAVAAVDTQDYPLKLTSLYDDRYRLLNRPQLDAECARVFRELSVTRHQASNLVAVTRGQATSDKWFPFRKGRITASQFGKICNKFRRQNEDPMKTILQTSGPGAEHASGIDWGKRHESDAVQAYAAVMKGSHGNFRTAPSGLIINPEYPHLGATPDAIVECSCHGRGVVEVKCPYKHRSSKPCTVDDGLFFLSPHRKSENVCPSSIRKDHNIYYQVQGETALAEVDYCDFVCWTERGLHIERVALDPNFWSVMKAELDEYFERRVLPKLLTRRY